MTTEIEYEVVSVYGRSEFVVEVNEMIRVGWEPLGGASESEATFVQAMIRPKQITEYK